MANAPEKIDVDLLVVGTGNGGLVAALCAYEMGVKNVLTIEKSAKYGGTSGRSGGGVWVPWSRYAQAAGAQDSLEEGREYLRQTIPADKVPAELLDTYIAEAPKMLDFLHERTRVRYEIAGALSRLLFRSAGRQERAPLAEPEPIYRDLLGEEGKHLSETTDRIWMLNRIAMTQVDAQILIGQVPGLAETRGKADLGLCLRHSVGVQEQALAPPGLRLRRHRPATAVDDGPQHAFVAQDRHDRPDRRGRPGGGRDGGA